MPSFLSLAGSFRLTLTNLAGWCPLVKLLSFLTLALPMEGCSHSSRLCVACQPRDYAVPFRLTDGGWPSKLYCSA
nr:MAG TPA: hypothetical protein [Caudoviricetes sp.]